MSEAPEQNKSAGGGSRSTDVLYSDLECDNCGKKYNTAFEGVTTSHGRELCVNCSWSGDVLDPGEFIPD